MSKENNRWRANRWIALEVTEANGEKYTRVLTHHRYRYSDEDYWRFSEPVKSEKTIGNHILFKDTQDDVYECSTSQEGTTPLLREQYDRICGEQKKYWNRDVRMICYNDPT
jgi:hypothetical protein